MKISLKKEKEDWDWGERGTDGVGRRNMTN